MQNRAEKDTIESFLINDSEDSNGFSMDWAAIKSGAEKWIGVPAILYRLCDASGCRYDHTAGRNLPHAQALSEGAKVAEIVDVRLEEATHTLYGVQRPEDPRWLGMVCSGQVEFVSQSVWLDEAPPDPEHIHVAAGDGYTPVHLAYVDDPAYGPQARVTDRSACQNRLIRSMGRSGMEENPEKKEEQQMSMADEIHEIHSMLKSMMEHKADSMDESEHKADSRQRHRMDVGSTPPYTPKPSYSFAWPDSEKKKSNLLCDLVS